MNIKEAFLVASKYIPKSSQHAVLTYARVESGVMMATDLSAFVEIFIGESDNFNVSIPLIERFLKKSSDVKVSAKNDDAILTAGGAKYTFPMIDDHNFPEFPVCKGDRVNVSEQELAIAFSRVKKAISKNDWKRILTGVNLSVADGKAYLTATDGHHIAQTSMAWDKNQTFNITIPPKLFEGLSKKTIKNQPPRMIEFWQDGFFACIKADNVTVKQRLLEGSFPAIGRLDSRAAAVLDLNFRYGLLDNLAIAKAYGSKTIDIEIVEDELKLSIEMMDSMRSTFDIPTQSPSWLAYSAHVLSELTPLISYMRVSRDGNLTANLSFEYVSGAIDYRLPIHASCSQKVTVEIKAFENIISSLSKDSDILLNLNSGVSGLLEGVVSVGSLGDRGNTIWALMPK